MHVTYNRKEDILVLELSPGMVDHAEESGPLIAHFSAEGKLSCSKFSKPASFSRNCQKQRCEQRVRRWWKCSSGFLAYS